MQQVYLCTLLVTGRVQFDWIRPQIVTHLSKLCWSLFHLDVDRESAIYMFKIMSLLDALTLKNGLLAIGIGFLSALDPKLQAIMFNSTAILKSNVSDTESSK